MPSQLYTNDNISFVCARDFLYNGKNYKIGTDFPQDDLLDSPEVLVRTRRIIPVVESRKDKPRHWHREIQERALVLQKLGVQRDFDPAEHTVAEVKDYVEAHPEQAAEILEKEETGENRSTLVSAIEDSAEAFHPSNATVVEVNEYLDACEDEDEIARILDEERHDKNRKGILDNWELGDE